MKRWEENLQIFTKSQPFPLYTKINTRWRRSICWECHIHILIILPFYTNLSSSSPISFLLSFWFLTKNPPIIHNLITILPPNQVLHLQRLGLIQNKWQIRFQMAKSVAVKEIGSFSHPCLAEFNQRKDDNHPKGMIWRGRVIGGQIPNLWEDSAIISDHLLFSSCTTNLKRNAYFISSTSVGSFSTWDSLTPISSSCVLFFALTTYKHTQSSFQ